MRPKLLEIEGLQSFRDAQRIDFEALGETGLFGIFGPTGSGKSTVLDAVTFALYGKVKRADGGTQGIINTNMNVAKVFFTFELIKDNIRKTFRVERIYQRKKGTLNSCEPKTVRLIEITDAGEIPVCEKATQVSMNIKDLLGLSHEDFTRAVVLPQNSFQEFLLLNNSERRGMLERLFYLEEYGKQLQDKLNRKMAKLKSRIDVLSGELKGYADANDESLEEAKKAMEAAVSERDRVEKELELLELEYNEAKEVWMLVQELSLYEQKEHQYLALRDDIAKKRAQLENAEKADGLLDIILKNKELKKKLKETEKQLNEEQVIFEQVAAMLGETRKKYEEIKSKAVTEQPKLVGLKTRLVDALGIKSELKTIYHRIRELQASETKLKDSIINKEESIKKETCGIEALEQKLAKLKLEMASLIIDPEYRRQIQEGAGLESGLHTIEGNVNELDKKKEALNSTIVCLEKRLDMIRGKMSFLQKEIDDLTAKKLEEEATMPEGKAAAMEYMEKLHTVRTVYDVLILRKTELDEKGSRIAQQQSELKRLEWKVHILEDEREKAEALYKQCRLKLEDAIGEIGRNAAYMLSKKLKEGEPCPVCGSKQHPEPAVYTEGSELQALEKQVEQARNRLAEAEKGLKNAEKEVLVAGEKVKALMGQINQAVQDLELKSNDYGKEKLRLPQEFRNLELEQIRLELERMEKESTEKLKAVEDWEKKQDEYTKRLQKINETMAEYRLSENGVLTELKVNRTSLEQIERSLKEVKELLDEKKQKHMEFLQQHKIGSAASELERLGQYDRRINELQKKMDRIQESVAGKRTLLEQWKEELRALNNKEVRIQTDIAYLNRQKDEKEAKLQELAGNTDIEDEIRRIDEKLEGYTKYEKRYRERLETLENEYNSLVTRKSLLANQKSIYSENLDCEEARLKTALIKKGFTDCSNVESSVIPPEERRALKHEIDEYDRTWTNIQAQKGMVLKKLDSRSITEDEWNRISNAYRELVSFKEECVSHSRVAINCFENLKAKHDKWVELNKTYKELDHKQSLFEQIRKLLRAEHMKDNSFIDYIAEERLRYVAVKASEILGTMTKYKYALELDTDAGFIIRDNANGGVHRMVTSLSGGETFLTSLSLALALSEQIQLKGQSPLEFFFLDEGFGTLDNTLLDSVIDSLERLSRKERVIGLISHVPELRSRIARRLIVESPTSQGDGSRVRIEKA